MPARLADLIEASAYQGYTYSYPHKSAYRPLEPAEPLDALWRDEKKHALFLYVHVPFCAIRCGFCNLFTMTRPAEDGVGRYLRAVRRQAERVAAALGPARAFSRLAVGGGTPTFLSPREIEELFLVVTDVMGAEPGRIPVSVEVSPETATRERLLVLRDAGVDRISIGVQSFDESVARALGRPQSTVDVRRAVDAIRRTGFRTLNLDLIYGAGEPLSVWVESLEEALSFHPEELFLYPLYVRPLTGLSRTGRAWSDSRREAYRAGRDVLLSRGYRQRSMRYFQREPWAAGDAPAYSCQSDGMVGLGAGARSYTTALHYSTQYAVGRTGVSSIIDSFCERTFDQFLRVDYGCRVSVDERRRRFAMQSLLLADGLDRAEYARTFGGDVLEHLPWLVEIEALGLGHATAARIQLSEDGLALSDVIGPWLGSQAIRKRMEAFECR